MREHLGKKGGKERENYQKDEREKVRKKGR